MTTRMVTALETVFGVDAEPLLNLRDVFLTYTPGRYSQLSELLRLDISRPPVPWRIKIRSRCWARPQISQDGLTVAARSTM